MSLLRATEVLAAGHWDASQAGDRIRLDYDARHRRRFRYQAEGGTEFLLDLARVRVLQDGDGLRLDDGRLIAVQAAAETLTEVRAADPAALLRLAWHIGNRHLPAQLDGERILIREDHVITAMLRGLGAELRTVQLPFAPESGAYAGGHAHGPETALTGAAGAHAFVLRPGALHGH